MVDSSSVHFTTWIFPCLDSFIHSFIQHSAGHVTATFKLFLTVFCSLETVACWKKDLLGGNFFRRSELKIVSLVLFGSGTDFDERRPASQIGSVGFWNDAGPFPPTRETKKILDFLEIRRACCYLR